MKYINEQTIRQVLKAQSSTVIKAVVAFILMIPTSLFIFLVYWLTAQGQINPISENSIMLVQVLSFTNAAMFIGSIVFSRLFDKVKLQQLKGVLETGTCFTDLEFAGVICSFIRKQYIIKISSLIGVSFLGLLVCLIGMTDGVIYVQPLLWINCITYFYFCYMVISGFPSTGKIVQFVKKNQYQVQL